MGLLFHIDEDELGLKAPALHNAPIVELALGLEALRHKLEAPRFLFLLDHLAGFADMDITGADDQVLPFLW